MNKYNWTLDGYKHHYGSYRVFATRAQARLYAKRQGRPLRAIARTLKRINSAIDDVTGELYRVAPDGSYSDELSVSK